MDKQHRAPGRNNQSTLVSAVIGAFFVAFLYFVLIALPVLQGDSDITAFVGDSFRYHRIAESQNLIESTLSAILAEGFVLAGFGLFGVSAVGWLLHFATGEAYYFFVFALNFLLLVAALRNYALVFEHYRHNRLGWFLILLLLNPFLYATVSSLNKEIWGIFFVSAFLRYDIFRQYGRLVLFVALSLFLRDAYFAVGIAFLFIRLLPFRRYVYLVGVSLLIPILQFNLTSLDLEQRSAALFGTLGEIEAVPLGYLITYPIKVVIQLFSAAAPHRYLEISPQDLYGATVTASASIAVLTSIVIVRAYVTGRRQTSQPVVDLFLAYTIVFCFIPFSVHRLFTPLIPLLALWAFSFVEPPPNRSIRPKL